MAAPKRDDFKRESDYERITSLYLRGARQADIAAELELSRQQISYDLRTIQKRWRESTTLNLDEAKQKELARIDELEREFWLAWEQSKSERTKARQETGGKDRDGRAIVTKASMEKEQRDGNPSFLQGVLSCIDRRCKLLGLDAPTRQELSGPAGGPMEMKTKHDLSRLSVDELLQLREIMTKTGDAVPQP